MKVADTQTILWLTSQPHRLSARALAAATLAVEEKTLAICCISLSEIAQGTLRGRILLDRPLRTFLEFLESEVMVLPITAAIAERAHQFSKTYPGDPADRLIGATAVVNGAELITADRPIRASGEVDCIW